MVAVMNVRILSVFIVSLLGCAHNAKPSSSNGNFAEFVDRFFNAEFSFRPGLGTRNGLHAFDAMLGDTSKARHERRIHELHEFWTESSHFISETMPFNDQIDLAAIRGRIQGELLSNETLREYEHNPMSYVSIPGGSVDGIVKRNYATPAERLVPLIARLRAIPRVYEDCKINVQNPPKEFTDLAIRMAKGFTGYFDRTIRQWGEAAAGKDEAKKREFRAALDAVVASVKSFSDWLEKDLLPRSHGSYAIGQEAFLAKLKYDEGIETNLETLLARGEEQLNRDYATFLATAKEIDPRKSAAAVMKELSDEHPTASDLIPSVRRSLEAAREFLIERNIVTIPSEVRPRVEETPPYARSGSFALMDVPGAYETKATEAFYYVTPVEPEWDAIHQEQHLRGYNPYVVSMINVHEAFPGHYLQFLYSKQFPTKTRKLLLVSSNAEGWAHYAEQMMVERGFGDNNAKIRLAQLQEALLRDCRYVVGIKLHTQGMTVEDGAKIFVEKGFQEPANAYEEARRGAYNPTYLYYTLGKLEIQKLRDQWLAAHPGKTLTDFHNAFVAQGSLPIPLVRRILFNDVPLNRAISQHP